MHQSCQTSCKNRIRKIKRGRGPLVSLNSCELNALILREGGGQLQYWKNLESGWGRPDRRRQTDTCEEGGVRIIWKMLACRAVIHTFTAHLTLHISRGFFFSPSYSIISPWDFFLKVFQFQWNQIISLILNCPCCLARVEKYAKLKYNFLCQRTVQSECLFLNAVRFWSRELRRTVFRVIGAVALTIPTMIQACTGSYTRNWAWRRAQVSFLYENALQF